MAEPFSNRPLSSWNEGQTKVKIISFVEQACGEGTAKAVPVEERVAVFDNDGTLWCEKPMPIQLDFILRRLVEMAHQDDGVRGRQPWKAAFEKDYGWLGAAVDEHYTGDDTKAMLLAAGVLAAYEGISIEEFEAKSDAFLRSTQHPTLGRSYLQTTYAPMVELLSYLETNGFSNFVVSGCGLDFISPVTEELYGIPRERVIGSATALEYVSGEGGGTVIHKAKADYLDDGTGSRCASGAEPGADRSSRPAMPTETSPCWTSRSTTTSLSFASLSSTTMQTVNSTMSPVRNRPSNEPPRAARPSRASRTTGARSSSSAVPSVPQVEEDPGPTLQIANTLPSARTFAQAAPVVFCRPTTARTHGTTYGAGPLGPPGLRGPSWISWTSDKRAGRGPASSPAGPDSDHSRRTDPAAIRGAGQMPATRPR